MIDQVLKEIGIEGGSLARLGGLMREASDMQRVAKEADAGRARRRRPAARARRAAEGRGATTTPPRG